MCIYCYLLPLTYMDVDLQHTALGNSSWGYLCFFLQNKFREFAFTAITNTQKNRN